MGDFARKARIAAVVAAALLLGQAACGEQLATIERDVFQRINKERVARGTAPLVLREDLLSVARWHSEDQARRNCLSHSDSLGQRAGDRLDAHRIPWLRYGENVGKIRGYADVCGAVVDAWLESPGHAENLLDARLVESAVGVAQAADGTYYLTQVFVTR